MITKLALKNHVLMFAVLIVLIAMGVSVFNTMPRNDMPPFKIRFVSIVTYFAGASPERVENLGAGGALGGDVRVISETHTGGDDADKENPKSGTTTTNISAAGTGTKRRLMSISSQGRNALGSQSVARPAGRGPRSLPGPGHRRTSPRGAPCRRPRGRTTAPS